VRWTFFQANDGRVPEQELAIFKLWPEKSDWCVARTTPEKLKRSRQKEWCAWWIRSYWCIGPLVHVFLLKGKK
jgi:hypothetical protein